MKHYLRLMRPANLVTAAADVVAGASLVSIFGYTSPLYNSSAAYCLLSTLGLYGGGVVFNDFFDADLDRVERPERPIPSGAVSRTTAGVLGAALLLIGIGAAFAASITSGALALAISALALFYDARAKHHSQAGPLFMGACRGLNLLLGLSAVPAALAKGWWLGAVPLIFIAAITSVSRGEVHGGGRAALRLAAGLYAVVALSVLVLSVGAGTYLYTVPALLLFLLFVYPPLLRATARPEGPLIGKAVKAGVLSLILLDAAWAAAAGQWVVALLLLLLLPLSLLLARAFAVT